MPDYDVPFADAIHRFFEAGIRFVIIGGVAMNLHGSNYGTEDVDFAYAVEQDNVEALANLLAKIHARVLARPRGDGFVITPNHLRNLKFLNLVTDLGEVDVMREIPGIESFEALWDRSLQIDLGGIIIRYASIDDLLSMKRAANRPKDQLHIYELLALKKLTEEEQTPIDRNHSV